MTLCKRCINCSLYSVLPSIIPVTGFENHSLNSRCEEKTYGIRKCINDHNSIKSFCNGVPVNNKRLKNGKNKTNILFISLLIKFYYKRFYRKNKKLFNEFLQSDKCLATANILCLEYPSKIDENIQYSVILRISHHFANIQKEKKEKEKEEE